MPIYEYQCTSETCGHRFEYLAAKPYKTTGGRQVRKRCPECGMWSKRAISLNNVSGSGLGVKGSSSVYWPGKRMNRGRWIENLTPNPVYVENKDQYRKLLKDTNSREAG